MKKLMELAAKRAAKKRKRTAALKAKTKSRKVQSHKTKPLPPPQPGTIAHDRMLITTLRDASHTYNAALSAVLKAGIEVQQKQMVEARPTDDGLAIHAEPVWLGRTLRRY
ncbi:MAG TPA: hypothetical protein VEC60_15710 [Reyranella sp.]|nr:hypothetical protein [Reyranella sp.]